MISAYTLWKTAHILSAAILFGTGVGIAFFAWFGYKRALVTGEIGALRTVLRLTVIADACFTAPAVVFQVISGFVLMQINSWSLLSPWSITVFGLFLLIGASWLPVVVIQVLLSREADRVTSIENLTAQFHRRFALWFVLGIPAFVAIIILFFLMVVKVLPTN